MGEAGVLLFCRLVPVNNENVEEYLRKTQSVADVGHYQIHKKAELEHRSAPFPQHTTEQLLGRGRLRIAAKAEVVEFTGEVHVARGYHEQPDPAEEADGVEELVHGEDAGADGGLDENEDGGA